MRPFEYLLKTYQESLSIKEAFLEENAQAIILAAQLLGQCVQRGGKILILGNGGSAADAQHMAAEMIGRMLIERPPLPAIALTTDSSNITAVANDYGYEFIFLKQIQALAKPEDVIMAISTSGNSKNVISAVKEAKLRGCRVIGLTGGSGGALKDISDICLCARLGTNASRIQETHIFAVHSLVDLMDRFFLTSYLGENRASAEA